MTQGEPMTADDKCGLGAGLLALGLAAGFIFLCQLHGTAWDNRLLHWVLEFLPHREMVKPEAVFDAVLFVLAVPAGAYFFWKGAAATPEDGRGNTTS
jgi:hypothetical protein